MESYVCFLSTDDYLDGVLVLNENLKRLKSKYPLLCVINEKISQNTRNILNFFGIQYEEIKSINIDETIKANDKKYLKYRLDKLNIFSLVKYKKLVFIELDSLILENIDNLFNQPHISCPKDYPFEPDEYNSGIMVIEPNLKDYEELKKLVQKNNKKRKKSIYERDIINEYFKNINEIEYTYNMLREIRNDYCNSYDDVLGKFVKKKRVVYFILDNESKKVIHYLGKKKPFMMKKEYDDENYHLYRYYYNNVMKIKNLYNNMEQNDIVSVIVPIYNKEKYIAKCLDSIINQTYENLEILLIDDGSTDNSYKICLDYAKKDNRIRIIKKKNGGVSSARNKGLDEATGNYISFVDADDVIHPNMIFILMNNIKKYNLDFIQCGIVFNKEEVISCTEKEKIALSKKELIKEFLAQNVTCTIWDKIYKREVIKNLRFNEKYIVNEDTIFSFEVVKNANNFGNIGFPLYDYMYKKEDCLTEKFVFENNLNLLQYNEDVEKYIKENYPQFSKKCDNFVLGKRRYLFREFQKLIDNGELDKNNKIVQDLKKKIQKKIIC